MRAAVLQSFGGDVAVRDVPEPAAGAGAVVVAVEACGVGLTLERARTGALGGTAPRYGLEDSPEAYRVMQANEAFGRILVEPKR